jgi:hypothetical protein
MQGYATIHTTSMADEEQKQDNQDQPDPKQEEQKQDPAQADDKSQDAFQDDKAEPAKGGFGDEPKQEPPKKDPQGEPDDKGKPDEDVNKQIESFNKRFDQATNHIYKQTVESEVRGIITDNPEYKPYEDRIRRFVFHENRFGMIKGGLPVQTVVLEAIAPYLQKIGAEKARSADTKAKQMKVNGQGQAPSEGKGGPDYSKMTNEEILKINEQIKSGQYKAE